MRKWLAVFYKDFCLFLRGGSWLMLLLPFLLTAALMAGMGDMSQQIYVRPFPIAVRDLDDTIMSRSLLSQMEQVELFSEVWQAGAQETDEELLARGMAAVVTIPEDFFYELYTMADCPVEVVLNGERKLESALFRAIFSSVMDIIWGNQAAQRGLFRFCYGESAPAYESEMYAEASELLLRDALGRQNVFASATSPVDLPGVLIRRLLASILTVLAVLFSAAALKTLPEERQILALPRYRALGGSPLAFIVSKFMTVLILYSAVLLPIWKGVLPADGEAFWLAAFAALAGAFGTILALGVWTDSRTVLYGSNLFLLVSLVFGGSLWPAHTLPPALAALGRLTLPYHIRLGLELAAQGSGGQTLLRAFAPALILGLAGGLAAAAGLKRAGKQKERMPAFRVRGEAIAERPPGTVSGMLPERALSAGQGLTAGLRQEQLSGLRQEPAPGQTHAVKPRRMVCRLIELACLKGNAMVKGVGGLLILLAVALLCGMAVDAAEDGTASSLRLAVCDLDESALSEELMERLSGVSGLSILVSTEEDGRQKLLWEEAEGLLVIGEGYEQALKDGGRLPLSYESAAAALSAQGVREIVAGQVLVKRSRLRAVGQAAERLGHSLTESEVRGLMQEITQSEGPRTALYQIRTDSGPAPADPFVPGRLSLVSLAVLFTLFTAAPWSRNADGRLVEKRMYSLPYGAMLSYGSDVLALMGIGLLTGTAVLLAGGAERAAWAAMAGYVFCAVGLSLALVRFTAQEGRVDGLGPFLALILCLAGGCFMDLAQAMPEFARIASWTPPGQMLAAGAGSRTALGLLLAEGVLFLALGAPGRGGFFPLQRRGRRDKMRGQNEQDPTATGILQKNKRGQ